jgi:hypothetical protein
MALKELDIKSSKRSQELELAIVIISRPPPPKPQGNEICDKILCKNFTFSLPHLGFASPTTTTTN